MHQKQQNRGAGIAPASRDQLGGCSQPVITAQDWRWQLIACRYCLPSSMAREVALQCFGEGRRND